MVKDVKLRIQPGGWLRSSHSFKECVTAHWSMRSCAENITGLKSLTEDVGGSYIIGFAVEERSCQRRSSTVKSGGASGSENVGISNEIQVKTLNTEYPRFPKRR